MGFSCTVFLVDAALLLGAFDSVTLKAGAFAAHSLGSRFSADWEIPAVVTAVGSSSELKSSVKLLFLRTCWFGLGLIALGLRSLEFPR